MSIQSLFVNAAASTLQQHGDRIGVCLGKLTPAQIWSRSTENQNAVGNLVLHLAGNVRQWILSALGGLPDVRERDREFDTRGDIATDQLASLLQSTVADAVAVIAALSEEQLLRSYTAQNRTSTGVEAVFRVVEHFGQHTGQVIYATKQFTGEDLGMVMPRSKK